jgi:hypothetical protein
MRRKRKVRTRLSRPVAGIRVRGQRGHPEVRAAIIRFARWLREHRSFPTVLPVYLSSGEMVRTIEGELGSASFFAPYSKKDAPYVRIATGDYPETRRRRGRDNALAGYLASLAHELVHYDQWLNDEELHERGVRRQANRVVDQYAKAVDRP